MFVGKTTRRTVLVRGVITWAVLASHRIGKLSLHITGFESLGQSNSTMARHENFAEQTIQVSFKTFDRVLGKDTIVTAHILADLWQILIKKTATVKWM
jgi:hypothetical protein